MTRFGRVLILGFLTAGGVLHLSTGLAAQEVAAAAPASVAVRAVALTPDEMEAFLQKARVVSTRDAGNGTTGSRRATLSDGTITHDAHVQVIDKAMPVFQAGGKTELNFTDSYRYNIAAYQIARLLGLENVPMSVSRNMEGKTAAVTWWIDDIQMDEKERLKRKASDPDRNRYTRQRQAMTVFDELIQNKDRNQGNILWTSDWTMWLIDHTRAFRTGRSLMKPDQLVRIDRVLLDHLRAITREALQAATARTLTQSERDALLARRDRIVAHYDARIARVGEDVVFLPAAAPSP